MFRIFAGTFALLWLVGTVVSIGCVCNCASHGEACAADASPIHEHAAVSPQEQGHSPDAEHHHDAEVHQHATASHHDDGEAPQGHCGKNGCEEQCRCLATIQGFVQTPPVFVIPNPISQPVTNASVLCAAREHVFAAPPSETLRRAKPRDWVFTPVVCLGPAFRSLAPPAFV
ncbi:MAG: hypothetical protein IH623_06795 [Verrucomicrobia bacterium]|nr:hypothetical protein [Verrucomicrobiota bacterium]